MKEVTVLYFAQLAAQAGCSEQPWQTEANTLGDLFDELQSAHGWQLPADRVRFARNDNFCPPSERFDAGDVLAIMPPMSGG